MADIVVPIVLENLIKLGTYEANLLLGVKAQVDSLESDLRFIKVFLQNSAGKRNDPFLKELVDQIRDAALESEEVIDTYAAGVIRESRRSLLGKLFHCVGHAVDLHGVSSQISSIKDKIDNIYKNQEKYGIGEADQRRIDDDEEAEQSLQRRRRDVEEDDVVGLEKDATTLINQLTNQSNLQRDVLSIHGMGGLGKTTLARKIYNNSTIKNHFDCSGWSSVSQEFQIKRLLLELLKSFKQKTEETSKKTAEDLKDELREQLKGKRYLIVLDDIWSTQVWEEVSVAFPDESNGSRILITTRVRDVAWHASPTPAHEQRFLDENESWQLLQKKAFRGGEWRGLPNLEEPGRKLAKSCGGLPLSIVLLGGILASKEKSHRVWSRVLGNVNSYLAEGVSILKQSYNNLPRELKPCFLYIGMYPEDSEIVVKNLIELWIAEGFIQSARNTSIYDVAEEYLEKLIDRSMIQVAAKGLNGGVKTCRIHDLLRDLCISESRRDKFFDTYSIDNYVSFNTKSRRFSIQQYISAESLNFDQSSCARSLLFFRADYPISKSVWKQIYLGTKFIRVLYLFDLEIGKIPSQIGELIFLRCLFIRDCRAAYVSSSIWNCRHLETLHLDLQKPLEGGQRSLTYFSLPVMKNLRHLYMYYDMWKYYFNIRPRSLKSEPFWNLQVLSWVFVNQNTALVIAKFPNLRKLGLQFPQEIEECEVEKVMASIRKLESLEKLKIICNPNFGNWRNCSRVGTGLNLLSPALTNFSWKSDTFDWEIFKVLARQPHLRFLKIWLWGVQQPHELSAVAGDFPQLQVLKLMRLNITKWETEKDAMPNLQSLFIIQCPKLKYLPEDELLCRTNLQLVELGWLVADELQAMVTDFKIKYPAAPCKINIVEDPSAYIGS
ncbi:hypothetical protein FNV43_RR20365 [Rhamnella rubrinervis]|uniref:Uncharacterized protein n=1 Tax=Rhamnella rubrinervis TaxID=2594499 RepID=A0A8K0E0J5_9ROSA|nr:hypothetical protein FNV43_RR20365 [Rhamnella rubrinervis]